MLARSAALLKSVKSLFSGKFYCTVTHINILELRTTSFHFAFHSVSNRVSTWFQYFIVVSKQQYS